MATGTSGLAALAPGVVGATGTGVGATLAMFQIWRTLDGITRDSHTPVDPTL
ncbi:MAG: hypothetical protein HY319_32645 [Armatimonadetes bacterium]|nr:hypothetical protein [Armatimonadota bacterium]